MKNSFFHSQDRPLPGWSWPLCLLILLGIGSPIRAQRIDPDCVPVSIAVPPADVVVDGCVTNCATFSVTATGSQPITYQWMLNGAALAGATNDTYTVCPVNASNLGHYEVIARNPCGAVTSQPVALRLLTDDTPPELLCPRRVIQPCDSPAGAVVHFNVAAVDDCDTNVTVTCTPPSGSVFPPGTNYVTCEAVNAAGLRDTCRFPVIVYGDCVEPDCLAIRCPEDMVVDCEGPGGTVVEYEVETPNPCGRQLEVLCEPPSGSRFPVGLTQVICRVRDETGLETRCSFIVEVRDLEPPTVECPPDLAVDAQGYDGAVVEWETLGADACDSNVVVHCYPPSGSLFPVGRTPVTCVARDSSGNEATCGFLVTVREPHPLEIVPVGESSVRVRWYGQGRLQEKDRAGEGEWRDVTLRAQKDGDAHYVEIPSGRGQKYFRVAAEPLAPEPDEDGDGVPDRRDRCANTPEGIEVDESGCAGVEMAVAPQVILAPIQDQLDGLLSELAGMEEFPEVRRGLESARSNLGEATAFIQRAEVGEGLGMYPLVVIAIEDALGEFTQQVEALAREFVGEETPGTEGYGDTTDWDVRMAGYEIVARRLMDAYEQAVETGEILQRRLGDYGKETMVSGRIMEVDDAAGLLKLENGMVIGLPERSFEAELVEGNDVQVRMFQLSSDTGLATDIVAENGGFKFPGQLFQPKPLQLRIAPVQRMAPYFPPPYLLHEPLGYQHNGKLWLERGMRLAVVAPPSDGGGVFQVGITRYSMRLDLSYKNKYNQTKNVTLAYDLRPHETPVSLPNDMSQAAAVLTATVRKQQCTLVGLNYDCGPLETVCATTYNLVVRPKYSYAQAIYNETVVDLEDSPLESSFRPLRVQGVFKQSVLSGVPGTWFQAEGYLAFNNSASSYPAAVPIFQNNNFAIYDWDFFSPDDFFPLPLTGVTNAAGLRWPKVSGTHNGRPFSYACGLPTVVRDRVNECQTSFNGYSYVDCFYRLPFLIGYPIWAMGQGNFGGFTHQGNAKFAYDFLAPAGTPILAARGGVVVDLRETTTGNCFNATLGQCVNCGATPNNYVVVKHQDGTYGWYFHMPKNGVSVSQGQRVRRGDKLGVVGNTGCSSDPHVHFEVRSSLNGPSIAVNFEPCFSPGPGDALISTNHPW